MFFFEILYLRGTFNFYQYYYFWFDKIQMELKTGQKYHHLPILIFLFIDPM